MADKKINGSLEITGKLNPNASGYGFNLPPSSSLTADRTIATEKYVDSALSSKADLVNGRVPSTQLPSYVDDVIEFNKQVDELYWYKDAVSSSVAIGKMVFNNATASQLDGGTSSPYYRKFLRKISEPDAAWESSPESHKEDYYGCMEAVAPENGKIYVCLSNEVCYRWSGANIVEISKSIALGETSSTAYAGNKGKANADEIASLKEKTFNVINASDIVNNTLTQEQYDLITNGKPTLIKGELGNYKDLLFVSGVVYDNSFSGIGICIAKTGGFGQNLLLKILINETTKAVSFGSKYTTFNYDGGLGVVGLDTVNGKAIPTYPSTNTSPQALQIGVNGGNLSWSDDGLINVINAEDIVSQTLTEEQFSLFTNGKLTLIKGTYNNFVNALIMPTNQIAGTYTLGMIIGRVINGNVTISSYYLNNTTRTLYYYAQSDRINAIGGIKTLNGKDVPAYPANTGTFNLKQIDGTLTWTKEWYGTQAEYDALGTYDDNTIYNITEE